MWQVPVQKFVAVADPRRSRAFPTPPPGGAAPEQSVLSPPKAIKPPRMALPSKEYITKHVKSDSLNNVKGSFSAKLDLV